MEEISNMTSKCINFKNNRTKKEKEPDAQSGGR